MGERTRGTRKANQPDTLRTSCWQKVPCFRDFVSSCGWVVASPPQRRGPHRQGDDAGVYTDRRKWPLRAVLRHLCTLLRRESRYEYATRAAPGGTSASVTTACWRRPLAGPSRLVGKTDSARVAPLLGWHLRRGANPHEPPKSPDSWRDRPSSHCHSALNVPRSHVHHRVAV